jgi:hypothetical protein
VNAECAECIGKDVLAFYSKYLCSVHYSYSAEKEKMVGLDIYLLASSWNITSLDTRPSPQPEPAK